MALKINWEIHKLLSNGSLSSCEHSMANVSGMSGRHIRHIKNQPDHAMSLFIYSKKTSNISSKHQKYQVSFICLLIKHKYKVK